MPLPAPIVVFDDGIESLGVLADLRPIFGVRTGAMTFEERLVAHFGASAIAAWWVPEAKRSLCAEIAAVPVSDAGALPADVLVVNGRCVLPPPGLHSLAAGDAIVDPVSGAVVAGRLTGDAARALLQAGSMPAGTRTISPAEPVRMITDPWDVIRHRDAALAWDLDRFVQRAQWGPPGGVVRVGTHAVECAPTVTVFPGAVLDSTAGPIVIDDHAVLRSNCVVCGPAYIGKGSTVLEGAVVRSNCAIGPVCKVNGEVSGIIMQGHANKAHDGYAGDTWMGAWVNLGAGTITSNLLNTYGEIVAQASPSAKRQKTGLTFFGSIIGDHVKTAIGTRLMTGSVIGTGAMVAMSAHAPTAIGRFAWLTDAGERSYRAEKFLEVMHAVMGRRKIEPGAAYIATIRALISSGAM